MPDDFEEDTKMFIHAQKYLLWLGTQDIFLFTIYIMLNYVELSKYNNINYHSFNAHERITRIPSILFRPN